MRLLIVALVALFLVPAVSDAARKKKRGNRGKESRNRQNPIMQVMRQFDRDGRISPQEWMAAARAQGERRAATERRSRTKSERKKTTISWH